jgi:hypothetical protein
VVVASENDVRVTPHGSEEFFASLEHDRGMKRVVVPVRAGDTLEAIGKRFNVPVRTMERVNRRGRTDELKAGESIVVYAPVGTVGSAGTVTAANAPQPLGPLPAPPVPDLLP